MRYKADTPPPWVGLHFLRWRYGKGKGASLSFACRRRIIKGPFRFTIVSGRIYGFSFPFFSRSFLSGPFLFPFYFLLTSCPFSSISQTTRDRTHAPNTADPPRVRQTPSLPPSLQRTNMGPLWTPDTPSLRHPKEKTRARTPPLERPLSDLTTNGLLRLLSCTWWTAPRLQPTTSMTHLPRQSPQHDLPPLTGRLAFRPGTLGTTTKSPPSRSPSAPTTADAVDAAAAAAPRSLPSESTAPPAPALATPVAVNALLLLLLSPPLCCSSSSSAHGSEIRLRVSALDFPCSQVTNQDQGVGAGGITRQECEGGACFVGLARRPPARKTTLPVRTS